jgi:hypothetical protein
MAGYPGIVSWGGQQLFHYLVTFPVYGEIIIYNLPSILVNLFTITWKKSFRELNMKKGFEVITSARENHLYTDNNLH